MIIKTYDGEYKDVQRIEFTDDAVVLFFYDGSISALKLKDITSIEDEDE